jgi:hypothetical protein
MSTRVRLTLVVLLLPVIRPGEARAGMPSFTLADIQRSFRLGLSDPTRMRVEAISFFLLGLLVCAAVIRWTWNSLRREFPRLPRLSYGKAMGVVVLWGLLFVLVLTMISGARELMTPGAWEKQGLVYRLASDGPEPIERQISARHEALSRLARALFRYSQSHGHTFPPAEGTPDIPDELWRMPTPSGQRYVYVGGTGHGGGEVLHSRILAYEGDEFGPERLVLMSDSEITWMPAGEIERALKGER